MAARAAPGREGEHGRQDRQGAWIERYRPPTWGIGQTFTTARPTSAERAT
jgi:hypothetical protein